MILYCRGVDLDGYHCALHQDHVGECHRSDRPFRTPPREAAPADLCPHCGYIRPSHRAGCLYERHNPWPKPDPARAAFVEQVRRYITAWGDIKPLARLRATLEQSFTETYMLQHGQPATLEAIAEALRGEGGPT